MHNRFPCVVPIDTRFRDIDALGHVNNATYLTYFEQARIVYAFQLLEVNDLRAIPFILAEVTVSYHRPAFFGDRLHVGMRIPSIGNKSFVMECELLRDEQELIATSRSVMVWYDYAAGYSVPVPESFRLAVQHAQGGFES